MALSGAATPSVLSLRLTSSRVASVNARLEAILPVIEADASTGAIISVDDGSVRVRRLPVI